MSLLRPKRSAKATENLSEHIEAKYLGIAIHIETEFSGCFMWGVAELQNFWFLPETQLDFESVYCE